MIARFARVVAASCLTLALIASGSGTTAAAIGHGECYAATAEGAEGSSAAAVDVAAATWHDGDGLATGSCQATTGAVLCAYSATI